MSKLSKEEDSKVLSRRGALGILGMFPVLMGGLGRADACVDKPEQPPSFPANPTNATKKPSKQEIKRNINRLMMTMRKLEANTNRLRQATEEMAKRMDECGCTERYDTIAEWERNLDKDAWTIGTDSCIFDKYKNYPVKTSIPFIISEGSSSIETRFHTDGTISTTIKE